MDTLLVFDVDGTLTGPRRRMHEDFSRFFKSICRSYPVFLVSGSDMPKLEEQLPRDIIKLVSGIFPCSGNAFIVNGDLVYRKEHDFPAELNVFLKNFVESSDYPVRTGNHIESRTGTLNVSVVGRNADAKQRSEYFSQDQQRGERIALVDALNTRFPDYEANVGGQISIDITPKGWNKSRVYSELSSRYPESNISFFGDNMHLGGNDRPLGDAVSRGYDANKVHAVEDHYDTWKILQDQYCKSAMVMPQVA